MELVQCETFAQWRDQARALLSRGVTPDAVVWQSSVQQGLFSEAVGLPVSAQAASQVRVPADFLQQAQSVACFRGDEKWPLLYRIVWRLVHEQRDLLKIASDADVRQMQHMLRVVSRDCHKMKAFVRFQKMPPAEDRQQPESKECFSAWYEPQHLIVETVAPFFAKRFAGMNWSILTPDACAHWYDNTLSFSHGTSKPAATEDGLEQLWLAYYRSTFNPARLKIKAMQAEMPKRYWRNLPEAQLIAPLIRGASSRVQTMLHNPLTDPEVLRSKSKALRAQQDALRQRESEQPVAMTQSIKKK